MEKLTDWIQYINQTTRLLLKSGLDTELVLSSDGFGAGWFRRGGGTTDEDRKKILAAMTQAASEVESGIIARESVLANVRDDLSRNAGAAGASKEGVE